MLQTQNRPSARGDDRPLGQFSTAPLSLREAGWPPKAAYDSLWAELGANGPRNHAKFETPIRSEFKALVKGDGGLIVYGPSRAFGRVATLRRGFGALGFDPRAIRPARNAPSPAPDPPKLSRSRSPSEQGVRRGGGDQNAVSRPRTAEGIVEYSPTKGRQRNRDALYFNSSYGSPSNLVRVRRMIGLRRGESVA